MLGEASAETAAETAAGTHWADIYVSTYLDTVCLHLPLPRPIYKHGGDTRSSRRFPRFSSVPLIISNIYSGSTENVCVLTVYHF